MMARAADPWWVIGSAAVALYGGTAAGVRDVDVVLSLDDARSLARRTGMTPASGTADGRFRSACFMAWAGAALPIEFMAGFEARIDGEWQTIWPGTREAIAVNGAVLFVPSRRELRAMLTGFGRDKDRARIVLLDGTGAPTGR